MSPGGLAAALLAIVAFLASASADPRGGDTASLAAQAFATGRLEQADHLYEKALAASPGSVAILVNAAAVKTRLGKIPESRSY